MNQPAFFQGQTVSFRWGDISADDIVTPEVVLLFHHAQSATGAAERHHYGTVEVLDHSIQAGPVLDPPGKPDGSMVEGRKLP